MRTLLPLNSSDYFQVVVTTYQTLNQDFNIPKDCKPADEAAWLEDNG